MSTGEGFRGKYADPDPLQAFWDDPKRLAGALYVHDRFLVMADEHPVAPNHLLVVAREQRAMEALDFAEYQAMWALTRVVSAHMTRVLRPRRKVATIVWGNQVETAHVHLVPRNEPGDATTWQRMDLSPDALDAQLAETRQLLALPDHVRDQADFVVNEMLARARITVPGMPPAGKQ